MKDKIKTIEVLKKDLGENQYRNAVIRIVSKNIVDQWDRKHMYSKSLNINHITERINLTLINLGIEPVSYVYVQKLAKEHTA